MRVKLAFTLQMLKTVGFFKSARHFSSEYYQVNIFCNKRNIKNYMGLRNMTKCG